MGAGRPAIVGQGRVKDVNQSGGIIAIRGRRDVGGARGEVLKGLPIGQPTITEQVEAGGGNRTPGIVHLRAIHAGG
jgi:hypothetical protein